MIDGQSFTEFRFDGDSPRMGTSTESMLCSPSTTLRLWRDCLWCLSVKNSMRMKQVSAMGAAMINTNSQVPKPKNPSIGWLLSEWKRSKRRLVSINDESTINMYRVVRLEKEKKDWANETEQRNKKNLWVGKKSERLLGQYCSYLSGSMQFYKDCYLRPNRVQPYPSTTFQIRANPVAST